MTLESRKMIFMEFLSSSDSSDDEMNTILQEINKNNGVNYKSKIKDYIEKVVCSYSSMQFKEHFRMSRSTCCKLINLFGNSEFFPKNTAGGKAVKTVETHVLSFIWYAGNKSTLRSVADRFNCSLSTLYLMFDRVMNFLLYIAPNVIHFPSNGNEKRKIAADFQRFAGFPGVIGCIDGTYVPIRTPAHKLKSTYINRHDNTSITLQGICDANLKFIDCFTGISSKIHDARVLRLSFIWPTIQELESDFHVIGDSAYPLSQNLLTPFRDYGQLTNIEQNYNNKFAATRVKIENCFGLLKGRFRQLIRTDFHSVIRTSKFIICCCVLHNICIENEDVLEEIYVPCDEELIESVNNIGQISREAGLVKRNQIASTL